MIFKEAVVTQVLKKLDIQFNFYILYIEYQLFKDKNCKCNEFFKNNDFDYFLLNFQELI